MRVPKYRRHSVRDKAFVELGGRRRYLPGRYGSAESRRAYARLIAGSSPRLVVAQDGARVRDLVAACLDWALPYYGGSGEYDLLRYACRPLLELHGHTPVAQFGPLRLKAVRDVMIDRGWARRTINNHVGRIRRIFRWAVEHELVEPSVLEGLRAVAPLKAGRSEAPDPEPVRPVPAGDVCRVLPLLSPTLSAMVQLQRLTGMRSDNLCSLSLDQLDRAGEVWWYRPAAHKGGWRGRVLEIPIGPQGQAAIAAYGPPGGPGCPVFSPRDTMAWRAARRREARQTPLTPSQRARTAKQKYARSYTPRTYYRAVVRAVKRAGVPHWHPHQLRHSVATEIRRRYGVEAAQVYLGHARADVTQVYAERDRALAARIASELG